MHRTVYSLAVLALCLVANRGVAEEAVPHPPEKARLQPLQESEWTDEQRALLEPLKQDGRLLNIFATLGHNPALMRNFLPFGGYILNGSGLPARHREMLMLRIGWLCQSKYEWAQHARIAKAAGLSDEEIHAIAAGPEAGVWSAFEATLLRAADELHYDAIVSDATWAALAAEYPTDRILDAILTVGQYNQVSMALNSLGVELEAYTVDSLPRDLPLPKPKTRGKKTRLNVPRIEALAESEWTDEQRALLERLPAQSRSLNIYNTFARYPKMFGPRLILGSYLRSNSSLEPRHREILILRTAHLQQCAYEWAHHARIGVEEGGLSEAEVRKIASDPEAGSWTEFERALIDAADQLHDAAFVLNKTWSTLESELTPQQLIDAVFTVSGYNMLAMALNSVGVQVEPAYAP